MNQSHASSQLPTWLLDVLRLPGSHQRLEQGHDELTASKGGQSIRIPVEYGIPLFATEFIGKQGLVQQAHYDRISTAYVTNLAEPHTQEYSAYLDRALLDQIGNDGAHCTLEVCCGHGEAAKLLAKHSTTLIGLDVSRAMLQTARQTYQDENHAFIQADATNMPIATASVDMVIMLGGIHHVPDRSALFEEVFRVLKPGGRFVFREPVSDFFVWRWLRQIIYRISPMLDNETERPLRWTETVPLLQSLGFEQRAWKTYGWIGFCFFMNSDVLYFNRGFRWIPGIRRITRGFIWLDNLVTSSKPFSMSGLQVVGEAVKPMEKSE